MADGDDAGPADAAPPDTPADGPPTAADLRAKAQSLQGDVRRRDFAYPPADPRHWCLPYDGAPDGDGSGSDGEFVDNSMDAFDDSTSSLGSNFSTGWGRTKETVEVNCNQLLADLDLAKMLEAKLVLHQFTFAKAKAMYEFQGVTEWEMTVREGEGILLLDRRAGAPEFAEEADMSKNLLSPLLASVPEPAAEDRTASIDSPTKPLPSVAIYLRPRSFALDLDRFLDYRRLYPDGWSLGLKVKIKVKGRVNRKVNAQGRTRVRLDKDGKLRVRVKLVDKGLVPTNYVDVQDGDAPLPSPSPATAPADASPAAEGPASEPEHAVTVASSLDDLAEDLAPLSVADRGPEEPPSTGDSGDEGEKETPA